MEWAMKREPGGMIVFLLKLYKRFVSPLLPPLCRFQPTCSEYMIEAIKKHGAIKGMLMGTARVSRCNPFCKGGFDPAPNKFTLLKNKNPMEDDKK